MISKKKCVCTSYREYKGKGNLILEKNEIECYFKLIANHDGKREFDCYFYVNESNSEALKEVIDSFNSEKLMYCGFEGNDFEGSRVTIERIVVDNAYFDKTNFSILLSKKQF